MNVKRKLPRTAAFALAAAGLVLFAALGYFVLIAPQRSKVSKLGAEIAETQAKIAEYRQQSVEAKKHPPIQVADLFRLAKAMPDQSDMPGLLLALDRIAKDTGITFNSITPQEAVGQSGYRVVPIALVFAGNFYDLADFLFRLRSLVTVHGGKLEATGRLFSVDAIDFEQGVQPFPQIQASLTIDAFVYGSGAPAPSTPVPGAAGTGAPPAGTTAEPTPSEPPLPPVDGATAAGVAG